MAVETDIFLFHNWGKDESGRDNHYGVSLINKELKDLGYQTWFDEERMAGGIAHKMSQGKLSKPMVLLHLLHDDTMRTLMVRMPVTTVD